ncbi:MAG TPA: C1 family peptidase [Stellaceae bacterium]|nr:C1 family peptidase [Stellaceae bacterium]
MPAAIPHKIKRYGWIPDLPDARDHLYAAPAPVLRTLPTKVDLRPGCPPVYDQGQLGSCTANAIGAALQFDRMKQSLAPNFVPSRLFIYYNERAMEGTISTDSGAQIRDGIKCVTKQGACPELDWPYDITKFAVAPPKQDYLEALGNRAVSYSRLVQNLNLLKGCLASGYPFVFGFSVYESFESQAVAQTGMVPMPSPSEQSIGGHAVMAVGYDDSSNRFIVRNSWAATWGIGGYFMMPYAYVTDSNLADDLWTIRLVSTK